MLCVHFVAGVQPSSRVLKGGKHRASPTDVLIFDGFPELPRASALVVTMDCIVAMSSCEQ